MKSIRVYEVIYSIAIAGGPNSRALEKKLVAAKTLQEAIHAATDGWAQPDVESVKLLPGRVYLASDQSTSAGLG